MTLFSAIYQHNTWNGIESRSGPGSGTAATQRVGPAIVDLVARRGFTSVIDAACGDGWWMPDLPAYVGIDVAPEAIESARLHRPDRRYVVGDLRQLHLRADLVILRDVIQHLSLRDGQALLAAAFRSGRWVLASTYRGGKNVGCPPDRLLKGWAYDADLEGAPFGLPEPSEYIFDGYAYEGDGIRDPRKQLGLWKS